MKSAHKTTDYNYWPSVADMVLAAFMVLLILWFTESVRSISLIVAERSQRAQSANSRAEVDKLRGALADAERQIVRLKQKPPIITLNEAQSYRFDTGSAALSPQFTSLLETRVLPQLRDIFERYPVNTIEIIGHTDTKPVSGHVSNLDTNLLPVIGGIHDISSLSFGSNSDLGLMRAVAVRLILERLTANFGLQAVRFRTYSAAQTVAPVGSTGPDGVSDDQRRRIEIRFTRSED